MIQLRIPRGWSELEAHLDDCHGIDATYLDSDAARAVHVEAHRTGQFAPGRAHAHVW